MSNYIIYIAIFSVSTVIQIAIQKYIVSAGYEIDKRMGIIGSILPGILACYIYYSVGNGAMTWIYSVLIQILTLITLVDLRTKLIPNRLNLAVGMVGLASMVHYGNYMDSIAAFLLSGLLFFGLALISKGGIGGGDIKLIAPLGLVFGIFNTLFIIFYSFIFGAIAGIIMLISKRGSMKSELAMGPYIALATVYLIIFYHV